MKESYGKGLASHPGPESCVRGGDVTGEALTGEHAGQLLSCEIRRFRVPTLLREAEGHTAVGVSASHRRPCAVLDPVHAWKLLARKPGDPTVARRMVRRAGWRRPVATIPTCTAVGSRTAE